ncbi:MAG: TIGR03086 family protein [Microthrixaceae bacterium]|nr:TIGR03086 family protein [Microthrixaceae bacterium]
MNTHTTTTTQPATTEPAPDDPRFGFAVATAALHPLIAAAETQLDLPTPCDDFTVKELLEHLVLVMRRAAVLGRGEHWASVQQEAQDSGWGDDFRAAAHQVRDAWDDPAKLAATYEVPWGEFPGAVVLLTYTGELAVHGWDLATAIGEPFEIDDEVLAGALIAAQAIPNEGRDDPDMPFERATVAPADATVIEQMAALTGRNVGR